MTEQGGKTFPHTEEFARHEINLYAESDRASISYRYSSPQGKRSKKMALPKSLPKHVRRIPEDGVVPPAVIDWAQKLLMHQYQKAQEVESVGAVSSRSNRVRIDFVFDQIRKTEWCRGKAKQGRSELLLVLDWVMAVLGPDFMIDSWDQNTLRRLMRVRTTETIVWQGTGGGRKRLKDCEHNTARHQLGILSKAFDEVKLVKVSGRRVLAYNPLRADCNLPPFMERDTKERILPARYALMLEYANAAEETGRLRVLLAIHRWIGIRPSTAIEIRRRDILTTEEEISEALLGLHEKARYVPVEEVPCVAKKYARFGAIYLDRANVKQAKSGVVGVAQYDRVVPIGPALRAELDRYIASYWHELDLPLMAPLIPMESDDSRAIDGGTPQKWWKAAEDEIRAAGHTLRKLRRTRWAGFRKQRIYELKAEGVPDKEVYYTVGWSVKQGGGSREEGQLTVAQGVYLEANPDILLKASLIGEGNRAPEVPQLKAVT